MVPEINLTPQLEARFAARFAPLYGDGAVVSLHSGMTQPAAPEKLAGGAQRRGAHRAGHAHGGVCLDAARCG